LKPQELASSPRAPVVIGGLGGSGTRLIAQCLRELDFFMGSDLNESNDNLLFTLLFKRIEVLDQSDQQFQEFLELFLQSMVGDKRFTRRQMDLLQTLATSARGKLTTRWLRERVEALRHGQASSGNGGLTHANWGWKEPSTHVVLDRLRGSIVKLKYIHVARNGLDMAFSANQSQLRLWGKHFLHRDAEVDPQSSLRYWCAVHRRVLEIGQSMGADFLFLNYDDFCTESEAGIKKLCDFLAVDDDDEAHNRLLQLISPPASIGRFKLHDNSMFDEEDVGYVARLGFRIA